MKTYLKKVSSRLDRLHPWLFACVFGFVCLNLPAENSPTAGPTENKETAKGFTMYMGSDFAIEQDRKYHSIQDVDGNSFVIKIKGRETQIPMRARNINIKIEQALKIAPHEANLVNLKTERAYTPANDPYLKFASNAGGGADLALVDLANYEQQQAQRSQNNIQSNPYASSEDRMRAYENLQTANQRMETAMSDNLFSTRSNSGDLAGRLASEEADGLFDALSIAFTVSSEKPLDRPYVVVVARYREQGGKPDSARNWICAKALDPIGAKPTKVNMLQGGLPPGFELDDCQLRLYNHGKEIATSVAPRRVTLTVEEAFDYLLLSYLKRNKGKSLSSTAAVGKMPADAKDRLSPEQWQRSYYAKISKDGGKAEQVFLDQPCTSPAEPIVASLLENYRFFPALEKGVQIEGTAFVDLTQLDI